MTAIICQSISTYWIILWWNSYPSYDRFVPQEHHTSTLIMSNSYTIWNYRRLWLSNWYLSLTKPIQLFPQKISVIVKTVQDRIRWFQSKFMTGLIAEKIFYFVKCWHFFWTCWSKCQKFWKILTSVE